MGPDNCMPAATTATAMAFAGPEGAIGASISQGGPYRIAATQAMAMSDSKHHLLCKSLFFLSMFPLI